MTQAFNLALFANKLNNSGQLDADTSLYNTVNVANGGTNLSATPTNGQLLIGNGTGYTLATLSAGTGISISNSSGAITVTNSQPNATIDIQTFNSTGTWTKPTSGQTMAQIQVWGGGGGGGRGGGGAIPNAGGGGAYNEVTLPLSYLASTVTATVGTGGVGATSTGNGGVGGTSSFAFATPWNGLSSVDAYGGGGGGGASSYRGGGGGGGGQLSAGSSGGSNVGIAVNPGAPLLFVRQSEGSSGSANELAYQGSSAAYNGAIAVPGTGGYWHGGGGGGYALGAQAAGGNSVWGGGGGGGTTAGTSLYGGNGGANGAAGAQPGGGGGSSTASSVNGGNGGAGRIIVTCW